MKLTPIAGIALALLAGAVQGGPSDPLLIVSNRSGNAQIHRIHADGSGDHALTAGARENADPAWSPDGRLIAFTSYRDGNAEIYVMQADGSAPTRLTAHPMSDNAPAWLPDGRIAFRSLRDRRAQFFVMKADGSGLRKLTDDDQDKSGPVVSPDGRWIAYVAYSATASSEIEVVPVAGGPVRPLTAGLSKNRKGNPVWSPDGRQLLFQEFVGQGAALKSIDLDSGAVQALTAGTYMDVAPSWSPDGRRIAFVSSREGSRQERARGDIFVMNADGSEPINLTRHPGEDTEPVWSADGQWIFFVSLRDGRAQVYAIAPTGGEARRLSTSPGHDLNVRPRMSHLDAAGPWPAHAATATSRPPL